MGFRRGARRPLAPALADPSHGAPVSWDTFLRASRNPLIPPLGAVLDQALTAPERAAFTAAVRPQVESGRGQDRVVLAFLTAVEG